MNGGHCQLCGQPLTDASGHWRLILQDRGIFHMPSYSLTCCAYCEGEIEKMLVEYSEKMRRERKDD